MHRKQIQRTTINTVSIFRHPCSKHWLKGRLGRKEKLEQQLPRTIFKHVNLNAPWTANYLAFVKHNIVQSTDKICCIKLFTLRIVPLKYLADHHTRMCYCLDGKVNKLLMCIMLNMQYIILFYC